MAAGWVYLIIFIVALVVGYATAAKPKQPKPALLGDFDFPQTEDGTEQYVIFGDVWLPDWIVLGYGDLRTTKIKTKGGKK